MTLFVFLSHLVTHSRFRCTEPFCIYTNRTNCVVQLHVDWFFVQLVAVAAANQTPPPTCTFSIVHWMSNYDKTSCETKTKRTENSLSWTHSVIVHSALGHWRSLFSFSFIFQANTRLAYIFHSRHTHSRSRWHPRRMLRKVHSNFIFLLCGLILLSMRVLSWLLISYRRHCRRRLPQHYTYTLALISFTLVCYIVLPVALIFFYPFFHFVAVPFIRFRSFSRPWNFSYLRFSGFFIFVVATRQKFIVWSGNDGGTEYNVQTNSTNKWKCRKNEVKCTHRRNVL